MKKLNEILAELNLNSSDSILTVIGKKDRLLQELIDIVSYYEANGTNKKYEDLSEEEKKELIKEIGYDDFAEVFESEIEENAERQADTMASDENIDGVYSFYDLVETAKSANDAFNQLSEVSDLFDDIKSMANEGIEKSDF